MNSVIDLVDQDFAELVASVLADPEAAVKLLPEDEQQRYRECQQSIIDAAHWVRP